MHTLINNPLTLETVLKPTSISLFLYDFCTLQLAIAWFYYNDKIYSKIIKVCGLKETATEKLVQNKNKSKETQMSPEEALYLNLKTNQSMRGYRCWRSAAVSHSSTLIPSEHKIIEGIYRPVNASCFNNTYMKIILAKLNCLPVTIRNNLLVTDHEVTIQTQDALNITTGLIFIITETIGLFQEQTLSQQLSLLWQ